ncbi:MAG: SpoIIIAH-like family protein [Clostridia bacterium]|nr:SpoIIIAH-like family protein [Clostridia bacterium]
MNFKFGVIKKNQILASMVVLMLVVAGYLNYTYDPTKDYNMELTGVMSNNLGDTYLVESSSISTSEVSSNIDEISQTIEASGKVTTAEEYFASTRMERENLFAEQKETYEKMLTNVALDEAERTFAQEQIQKINSKKNALTIAENLIKLKGFKDVVILLNEDSTNVIVIAEKLTEEEKADIENIVVTELKVDSSKLNIQNL